MTAFQPRRLKNPGPDREPGAALWAKKTNGSKKKKGTAVRVGVKQT